MAIDRALLESYISDVHAGPVRVRIGAILAFVLDQAEADQQAAIDAWKPVRRGTLTTQKTLADTTSAALQTEIDRLR